jgi:hypothetical protein
MSVRGKNELKAVQETIQTESYSSVVAKSCSAALAPRKIEAPSAENSFRQG